MDFERIAVAERLAAEFPTMPPTAVMRAVESSVEQFPTSDPLLVEQAAKAFLRAHRGSRGDAT